MSGPSHSATHTSTFQFQSNTSIFPDCLPISAPFGPPAAESGKSDSTARYIHCRRQRNLQVGTMRDAAQGGRNASSHTSAGTQAARVSTLVKCVPNVLEFQRALTPYDTVNLTHLSMFANNALLGGGVRVRVWIREQRKIKRRSKVLLSL